MNFPSYKIFKIHCQIYGKKKIAKEKITVLEKDQESGR